MLDVHVLTLPGLPEEWEKQRRESINVAVSNSPYEVRVHEVPGIAGDFATSRSLGYSIGSFPYVTFVDDDDYVMPNAFSCLEKALYDKPDAVFTGEIVLYKGETHYLNRRHSLAVYDRNVVDHKLLLRSGLMADRMMEALVTLKHNVVDVPDYVYVYRCRSDSPAKIFGGRCG
jgi:hypothetical protein